MLTFATDFTSKTMATTLLTIQDTTPQQIESKILTVRGVHVMIDKDLAALYGIPTGRMNEQVKRNMERFPEHFRFQLTQMERDEVIAICDNLKDLKYNPSLPYCFTEQGVAMLSAVLHTPTAVRISVQIMEAFVQMRHTLAANRQIIQRLETIEHHQLSMSQHQAETDNRLDEVFRLLDEARPAPKQGIFFDGQVYDAYQLVSDLVRKAKKSIVLIDNYIDDTVLTVLDKRKSGVKATVYTKHLTKQLQLDIQRHNQQYAAIEVLTFHKSHDRFLLIDNEVYHLGASVKDLGQRWCAFSRISDFSAKELLAKIS
jgi:hypothetical protein